MALDREAIGRIVAEVKTAERQIRAKESEIAEAGREERAVSQRRARLVSERDALIETWRAKLTQVRDATSDLEGVRT